MCVKLLFGQASSDTNEHKDRAFNMQIRVIFDG